MEVTQLVCMQVVLYHVVITHVKRLAHHLVEVKGLAHSLFHTSSDQSAQQEGDNQQNDDTCQDDKCDR